MEGIERNLRLYGWHQTVAGLIFWFPTSFLYFIDLVGLAAAARLLAVYFLAVVVLEVPSGWMSDRFGRVGTLRLSAVAWVAAFVLYLVAGFGTGLGSATGSVVSPGESSRSVVIFLVLAQILLAAGYALRSGTDASFHFDTLEVADRSSEFEKRESVCGRNMFAATSLAAVFGGLLGYVDLRLPFAASLVAALWQFVVTMRLDEPGPVGVGSASTAVDPNNLGQIWKVVRYLRNPNVAWIFLFMTVQQPLEGLAGDQLQPWLTELVGKPLQESRLAALYSGLLMAVISVVGAGAVSIVPLMRSLLGLRLALALLATIETTIIVGMALVISPFLIPVLVLRSTQAAAGPVLVATEVSPLVSRHHRATFLSMGSLSGRLLYGLVLLGLGSFNSFSQQIRAAVVVALLSLLCLGIGALVFPSPQRRFDAD